MHVIGSETCDPDPLMRSPDARVGWGEGGRGRDRRDRRKNNGNKRAEERGGPSVRLRRKQRRRLTQPGRKSPSSSPITLTYLGGKCSVLDGQTCVRVCAAAMLGKEGMISLGVVSARAPGRANEERGGREGSTDTPSFASEGGREASHKVEILKKGKKTQKELNKGREGSERASAPLTPPTDGRTE